MPRSSVLGSLRFRLPALFVLGVVLAGVVASLISVRFFQSYTRTRAVAELQSEGAGIVKLYAAQAGHQEVPLSNLQAAIGGDHIFYIPVVQGAQLFVGNLPPLSTTQIDVKALEPTESVTFTFRRKQGRKHVSYLAVARPVTL